MFLQISHLVAVSDRLCLQNLVGYKAMIPNFDAYIGQLPQVDQQQLNSSYSL